MKPKKNKNADLERQKGIFFRFGLLFAMALALLAFEWAVEDRKIEDLSDNENVATLTEMAEITIIKEEKPAKVNMPQTIEKIEVKPDDAIIEKPIELPVYTEPQLNNLPTLLMKEDTTDEVIPFVLVDKKPEFKGGDKALIEYLSKNTYYDPEAVGANIQGTVWVRFVIDKNGAITNVGLERGRHDLLDKEALKVIRNMPKWIPGSQQTKPIKVSYVIPVKFVLD
ncbi:MAG: hypothetical protein A2W91_18920 [Bacteroidetes bacterium GWF2_38_335]|nr:MAG: hypothetical protein A2W91_18920 [Bacteroidetes bacterium GWF2_38_335]OFY80252.1 MAG: hypothetical protein A2281_17275 [Bacteroidetes bacterium RIFOXYA12_FULL_38_20]HBS88716.1 hypothetical protein [Bacteroidales bacterium]